MGSYQSRRGRERPSPNAPPGPLARPRLKRRAQALVAVGVAVALLGACGEPMEAKTAAAPMSADAPAPEAAPPPPPAPPGASQSDQLKGDFGVPERNMRSKAAPGEAKPVQQTGPNKTPQAGEAVQKQAPIIIYSATLTMAVFEVDNGLKRIEALGKEMGGFLAKREDTSIVIRVPTERFDETLHAIEKMGDMLHRSVTAEDVTEEYRDLDIRLRAAKAVQERLTQLLQRAQKVEESIAIERELDRVTVDIDRLEGRMKFLRDRAAFSTITVVFQPKAQETVSQNPFKMPIPWLSDLGLSRLLSL